MTDGWADPQSLAQPTIPPPAASNPMERYAGKIEDLQKQDEAAFSQEQSALAPKYSALNKTLLSGVPAPPQQEKVEAPPKPEDYKKNSMEWAGAMAVLGAVASKFTRQPGNAALNAFAGALKGWQQGNMQAYEDAAKEWEQANKKTIENNKMIMDRYKQILEDRKLNIDNQMASIQLVATQFHDKMMFDAAAAKNYTLVASIYEKNQQYTDKATEAAAKLQETRDKQKTDNEQKATYWLSPEGQQKFQTLDVTQQAAVKQLIDLYAAKGQTPQKQELAKFLQEHPDATAEQIQQFEQQGRPPRSAPAIALQKFIQEHPDATSDDITKFGASYAGTVAGSRTANQYAVRVDQAAGEAEQFAQNALGASERFPRGQFVPANKAIQAWQSNTSNPDLAEFGFYNFSLANAYARAVNPTGVPRIDTANKFLEHLSTAQSPEVYRRLVGDALTEIKGAQKSVRQTKEDAIGGGQQSVDAPATGAPKSSGTTSSGVQWSVQP